MTCFKPKPGALLKTLKVNKVSFSAVFSKSVFFEANLWCVQENVFFKTLLFSQHDQGQRDGRGSV